MSRGLKAVILILVIAALTGAGLFVISKTGVGNLVSETDSGQLTQDKAIELATEEEDAVGPTFETPAIVATEAYVITATATPNPTATAEPEVTAVPIPEVPVSYSDSPQINTATNMNGYIYASYKSEKKVKIMMDNGSRQEIYDLIPDGKFHRFTLHLGDGSYKIRLVENTTGKSYRVIKTVEFDCEIISDKFPYLVPNSFVVYDNSTDVIQFGLELTRDAKTDEEKAHAIYNWIVRNISYDFSVVGKLEVGYVPDPQRTFETRKGICSDFAALFAAMCRSQGIPCKVVLGYYVKSEYYHAWNEVFILGKYVIVDTSGDSQTEKYNFSRTEGYTPNKEH